MVEDEVQDGLQRSVSVLGQARLVVGAVAGKRFIRRSLNRNIQTLRGQAAVLRELADALEQLSNELECDYSGRPDA